MRDLVFEEIRKCNQYIRKNCSDKDTKQDTKHLADIILKMESFSMLARKEGFLALEMALEDIDGFCQEDYFRFTFNMILDGNDPEEVEEFALCRYFADGAEGYEGLEKLIILVGALAVQNKENPRLIEERLLAMVSKEVEEVLRSAESGFELFTKTETVGNASFDKTDLERLYEGEIAAEPGSKYYYQLKITDYAITTLRDIDTQRLLRDVDNKTLAIAMIGLSGIARKKILSNMSRQLAIMIAEDMDYMGPVRRVDAAEAAEKIFYVIVKLIDMGEISSAEGEGLKIFKEIFDSSKYDEEQKMKQKKAEQKLQSLMANYDAEANALVNTTKGA